MADESTQSNNQLNQLTKPNKLAKLTPQEKSHTHTRFTTCLRWSQGSYNAQVVYHFAVGHFIMIFIIPSTCGREHQFDFAGNKGRKK